MNPSYPDSVPPAINSSQEEAGTLAIHINVRRVILVLLVLLGIAATLFLIYQNGKSIYTHGI